ncbi:MAG: CHAT domain-containing protein, partial [Rubrivivax sp.]|nr:CHAT domain-containing protein [Rubrivivax sp.]
QLDAELLAAAAAARQGDAEAAAARFTAVLEHARQLGLVRQQVAAHAGEGELALAEGRPGEAAARLARALDLVDEEQAELGDDEFRVSMAALGEQAHALLVRAVAREFSAGEAGATAVFDAVERGRARALVLGLGAAGGGAADAEGRNGGGAGLLAGARRREGREGGEGGEGRESREGRGGREGREGGEGGEGRESREGGAGRDEAGHAEARWQMLRRRWLELIAEGSGGDAARHADELRRLERLWLEAQRRERLRRRDRAGGVPTAAGIGCVPAAAVQQALQADEALVAFHLDGTQLTACVLRRDAAACLGWAVPRLAEAVEALRFQIETPRHCAELLRTHAALLAGRVRARAAELHALVWAPLHAALAGAPRVVVVPHGPLHYVPWCALHDGQGWLVERHEIELAASASAWLVSPARPWQPPSQVLALATGDGQLPHAREEVELIAGIVGGQATVLVGDVARSDALRDAAAAAAQVVHFACHGRFRADSPAFSSLLLADGPLILQDLSSLRLRAALVVLSACETGLSRIAPGNEMVGLVRGFMLAGAERVLATQWAVPDISMAELMAGFYQRLRAGEPPRHALAAVQGAAARSGVHPFQWAALALYGRR